MLVSTTVRQLHDVQTGKMEPLAGAASTFLLGDELIASREALAFVVRVGALGSKPLELPATKHGVWSISLSADGSRLALVQPDATQLFDGRTGSSLGRHEGGQTALFAPDGTLFVATHEALHAIAPPR